MNSFILSLTESLYKNSLTLSKLENDLEMIELYHKDRMMYIMIMISRFSKKPKDTFNQLLNELCVFSHEIYRNMDFYNVFVKLALSKKTNGNTIMCIHNMNSLLSYSLQNRLLKSEFLKSSDCSYIAMRLFMATILQPIWSSVLM